MEEQRPKVGVGVLVVYDDKVLLGKRKNAHGEGEYAFPGGHLEYMEDIADCARRECQEEAAIEIENVRFQFLLNLKQYAPKHYVHIGVVADWASGEPEVCEPEKLESWAWYDLSDLPQPLFGSCEQSIELYKKGEMFFDV